ncbi:MAG: RNA polymerase sigma factor [Oscillospiraceae bacterium]|nr:RNA polymerase sigma factor [Oscillospiraceae bacterium]
MDHTDFERLYNTCYMQVYTYAAALSGSRDQAEELTQKTFFKAMTTGSAYRGGCAESTWLCAIAKNLFFDECRREKKRAELPPAAESGDNMEAALEEEDAAFHLHQLLHELEEPYKEVFQLRVFGELSFAKIAALFGKTENWARVTYYRARLKLQERMEEI